MILQDRQGGLHDLAATLTIDSSLARQAVGVCCTRVAQPAKRDSMTARFVAQLGGSSGVGVGERTLALLCLGEIGRQNDLSAHHGLLEAVMAEFASDADEV